MVRERYVWVYGVLKKRELAAAVGSTVTAHLTTATTLAGSQNAVAHTLKHEQAHTPAKEHVHERETCTGYPHRYSRGAWCRHDQTQCVDMLKFHSMYTATHSSARRCSPWHSRASRLGDTQPHNCFAVGTRASTRATRLVHITSSCKTVNGLLDCLQCKRGL